MRRADHARIERIERIAPEQRKPGRLGIGLLPLVGRSKQADGGEQQMMEGKKMSHRAVGRGEDPYRPHDSLPVAPRSAVGHGYAEAQQAAFPKEIALWLRRAGRAVAVHRRRLEQFGKRSGAQQRIARRLRPEVCSSRQRCLVG